MRTSPHDTLRWAGTPGTPDAPVAPRGGARRRDAILREERESTARWLHDRTLQALEYLAMGGYGAVDPARLQAVARTAADDLRAFLDDLHLPGEAADLGAALGEVVCLAQLVAGPLRIDLVPCAMERAPEAPQATALAAATREALANALRHADAVSVRVRFGAGDASAWVEVVDDGVGFDPERVRLGRGLRSSIVGRVVAAGGCARIERREGGGTRVRLDVPLAIGAARATAA